MTVRCIVIGDVMMDVTAVIDADIAYASDTPARVSFQPGGVAANTAAWMATAGHAVSVVGCVGDDPFGRDIRAQLSALGADVHLQESSLPTGTCVVIVDRRRERTMFPDSGANAALDAVTATRLIAPGTHVHLSGYTLLNPATRAVGLAALDRAVETGATRSLDPASAAPLRANLPFFLDLHAALEALAEQVATAVVKVGSRGVLARDPAGTVTVPALRHDVVDTTGAGDAFTAGFLPAWLAGTTLSDAIEEGQRLAGAAVGRVGASPLAR
jgi:ribokinase